MKPVRVIIAGSRSFWDRATLFKKCDEWIQDLYGYHTPIEIVSGTARGADEMGERYAKRRRYPVKRFPADWKKHGRGAGYIRNAEMAEYADALFAFWDGKSRGTRHMIDTAKGAGLEVRIYTNPVPNPVADLR